MPYRAGQQDCEPQPHLRGPGIEIPGVNTPVPVTPGATPPQFQLHLNPTSRNQTYVVQPGDTLTRIAARFERLCRQLPREQYRQRQSHTRGSGFDDSGKWPAPTAVPGFFYPAPLVGSF